MLLCEAASTKSGNLDRKIALGAFLANTIFFEWEALIGRVLLSETLCFRLPTSFALHFRIPEGKWNWVGGFLNQNHIFSCVDRGFFFNTNATLSATPTRPWRGHSLPNPPQQPFFPASVTTARRGRAGRTGASGLERRPRARRPRAPKGAESSAFIRETP